MTPDSVHMEDDDAARRAEQPDTPTEEDPTAVEPESDEEQAEREEEMGSVSITETPPNTPADQGEESDEDDEGEEED